MRTPAASCAALSSSPTISPPTPRGSARPQGFTSTFCAPVTPCTESGRSTYDAITGRRKAHKGEDAENAQDLASELEPSRNASHS